MDDRYYWMWIQHVFKPAGVIKPMYEKYGTAKAFYEAGDEARLEFFGSEKKAAYKRCSSKSPEDFAETVEFCQKHSLMIITPESEYYPKRLLGIKNFPAVLFVRGDYTCLAGALFFGVIGSRTPCLYGENAAKDIVSSLVENDGIIVSGGALGVDSIAHKAAIDAGGKTVLVMGCGHGYDYLKENADLRRAITKSGAVVSEYPPYAPVGPQTFPHRNRIISGMSEAVIIVEAAEYSGTFSTANHAKKQGKALFVLPGDINSGNFAGSNRLITEGAGAVFSGEDVLVGCGLLDKAKRFNGIKSGEAFRDIDEKSVFSKKKTQDSRKRSFSKDPEEKEKTEIQEKNENIIKNPPAGISKNAEMVYNIMSDGINELDEIKRETGLEVRHILVALTELEILGVAEAYAPNFYRIK